MHPGFNHLLFNKHDDVGVEYDPAYAMVAKVGWSTGHYRPAFDISLNPPCGKGRPGLKDAAGHVVPTWWADPDRKRENKYFLTFLGTMRNYPLRRAIAERFHDPDNGVIIQVSELCRGGTTRSCFWNSSVGSESLTPLWWMSRRRWRSRSAASPAWRWSTWTRSSTPNSRCALAAVPSIPTALPRPLLRVRTPTCPLISYGR